MKLFYMILFVINLAPVVSFSQSSITVTGGATLTIDGAAPNQADVCADSRTGTDGVHFIFNDDATWCSVATPVTLVSFDATLIDNETAKITWVTSSEINNDYFQVYRSYDFGQWEIIGKVEGFGTTTETKHYQIEEGPLYNGVIYYQLEQIDYDGTSELFDIISIEVTNSSQAIEIYPNPSSNIFHVQIVDDSEYTLVNAQGQIVKKAMVNSMNSIIDLSPFPLGIYFLNLSVKSGPSLRFKLIIAN